MEGCRNFMNADIAVAVKGMEAFLCSRGSDLFYLCAATGIKFISALKCSSHLTQAFFCY